MVTVLIGVGVASHIINVPLMRSSRAWLGLHNIIVQYGLWGARACSKIFSAVICTMPCVTHEQLCVHFMDGTLKMHAIIELEEYTVQKLNDKEGTYCLGVFNVTALDHHADKIGEPKNIMRDLNRKSPPELL